MPESDYPLKYTDQHDRLWHFQHVPKRKVYIREDGYIVGQSKMPRYFKRVIDLASLKFNLLYEDLEGKVYAFHRLEHVRAYIREDGLEVSHTTLSNKYIFIKKDDECDDPLPPSLLRVLT